MKESPARAPTPAGPATGRAQNAPPATLPADTDIHLLDRFAVIHRYRQVALSVFCLAAVAVMIQGYTTVRVYQAQARLLIESERSTIIPGLTTTPDAFYEDPEPYYQTQYKILKGRDLARRAARRLKLNTIAEFNG